MYKIVARPLLGVNKVAFGMKRKEVRTILGEFTEFRKSKYSRTTTDAFEFCHVYYNDNDECEAIELFDNVEIMINEEKIFPTSIESLKSKFPDIIEEYGSFISHNQSIAVYAPEGTMESILFGCHGYYE